MGAIDTVILETPAGKLTLGVYENALCMCDWVQRENKTAVYSRLEKKLNAKASHKRVPLHRKVESQLTEYFERKRTVFTVPLLFAGTDFQRQVWQSLQSIPYGTTLSYAQLAARLECDKAVRAVANANGANALSIFVPCHRVVGSDGKLTGYAGGLSAKKKLLELESNLSAC